MKKTETTAKVQDWNGEAKSDFMKTVCALKEGCALCTPAGIIYAPLQWRNGTPCVTFQDQERDTVALMSLNKIFARVRHFQSLNAENTEIVRAVRAFCLENIGIDEMKRVSCALPAFKANHNTEWCLDVVRLIRKAITGLGLISREKGVSSAFYVSISEGTIYLHITGCRAIFTKAERETMSMIRLEALHQ